MAYEIWETCMLVPGINKSNCSGWVQAWGSIIGLAVAVGVPLWLRWGDTRHRAETERAAATIVGSNLLLMVGPILGCINSQRTEFAAYRADTNHFVNPRVFVAMLQGLSLPDEGQMLQLSPVDPTAAEALAKGSSMLRQLRMALTLLAEHGANDPALASTQVLALEPIFLHAEAEFKKAEQRLLSFLNFDVPQPYGAGTTA